jgi:hypothetical protein
MNTLLCATAAWPWQRRGLGNVYCRVTVFQENVVYCRLDLRILLQSYNNSDSFVLSQISAVDANDTDAASENAF